MSRPPILSRAAAFALDLAGERDGLLAAESAAIEELVRDGLVTTRSIGDGFVIVKAIQRPRRRRAANGTWYWPEARVSP